MARTKIKVTSLTFNAGAATPTPTNVDQANGMYLDNADLEPPGNLVTSRGANNLVLEVFNTAAGPHNIIIRAGADTDTDLRPWPAFRGGLGDLDISVTNSSTIPFKIGPMETSRFKNEDGSINIDFDAGFTGTIQGFLLPKGAYNQ